MGGLAYATSATVIYAYAIVHRLSAWENEGARIGRAYEYFSGQSLHGGRCAPETVHTVSCVAEESEAAVVGVLYRRVVIRSGTLERSAYVNFFLIRPVRRPFLDKRFFQCDCRVQHSFERVVKDVRHFGLVRMQLVQQGKVA